jgi:23S rRNA (guanosine2251-2'-O)-methyltransferase
VKTSAGALHVVPVCKESSINEAIRFLKNCGFKVVATTEKASQNYTAVDYDCPIALVMGGEDFGISSDNLRICDELVKIPIAGTIASLNVSAAAAVMMYEAVRQRRRANNAMNNDEKRCRISL